jgi:drug/metabolite transporter (DMT)-like permease
MNHATNAALCITFVILWSSGWIGSKFGVGLTGPFTFLSWRYLFVVTLLGLCLLLSANWKSLTKREWLHHLNVGVLSHGVYLGASLSAMHDGISAGMVALVTSMQPVFTSIISQKYGGEKASRQQWIGVTLGLSAVSVIVINQITLGGSWFGYCLLIAAVLSLCVATIIDRSQTLVKRSTNSRPTPLLQVLFIHSCGALLFFTVIAVSLEGLETQWSTTLFSTLLYMAVIVSIGSYGLLFLLLRRLTAVKVSSLSYLTHGTTMLMAWVAFGETLSPLQWIGVLLATCSVLVIHCNNKPASLNQGASIRRPRSGQTQRLRDATQ